MKPGPKGKRPLLPWAQRLRAAIDESDRFSSRADFLRSIGIEAATVYRYEVGDRDVPLGLITQFAEELGVAVGDLLGEDVERRDFEDTRGWRAFVSRGYREFFRSRGATETQLAHARRTPFRGQPNVEDYVRILEGMMRSQNPEEAADLVRARRQNLTEQTPDASAFAPSPPDPKK